MLKYGEESVLEAGIIVAGQKGEHYEMAWLAKPVDCYYRRSPVAWRLKMLTSKTASGLVTWE